MVSSAPRGHWQSNKALRMNGEIVAAEFPAQSQVLTESWNRVVAVPYMLYMPEKNRLCMLVSCDYPHQPMILFSDDHGDTWGEPSPVSPDPQANQAAGLGTSLTYLGAGQLLLNASGRWFSSDYGETWEGPLPIPPASNGQPWHTWDPCLVDRDPQTGEVTRLAETGYNWETGEPGSQAGYQRAFIRFSADGGRTWSEDIPVLGWHAVSEVALVRASNGDTVAACRTDMARQYMDNIDHYEGLGTCVSEDDCMTWSPVDRLYDYGRHHPSLVLMADGSILMTYVVRAGYPRNAEGFVQFGIEAVISRDNGRSWDLPHRLVLAHWPGHLKGRNEWWPSSQATSTVLLPDGSLLTAFGTGYRCGPDAQGRAAPRDVRLIRWWLANR